MSPPGMANFDPRTSIQGRSWKKLRRLHPIAVDLDRADLLARAPLAMLTDATAMMELTTRLGLNDDGLDEYPADLHALCGQGLRVWQYPIQFGPYLTRLAGLGVRSYLELGVRHGGTFVATVEYLRRFQPLERAVGIDIMPCPSLMAYRARNPCVEFHQLNTQSPAFAAFLAAGADFDLALIDANHAEHECRREYELVRERASIVVLHDIVNMDFPGVAAVWREIQASGAYDCQEFTAQYPGTGPYMGLGLAVRRQRTPCST